MIREERDIQSVKIIVTRTVKKTKFDWVKEMIFTIIVH